MRVHEIAKSLGKANKEVLDILKEMGLDVKSHSSSVDDSFVERVKYYRKPQNKSLNPGLTIMSIVRKDDLDKAKEAEVKAAEDEAKLKEEAIANASLEITSVDPTAIKKEPGVVDGAPVDPQSVSKLEQIRRLESPKRQERMVKQREVRRIRQEGGDVKPGLIPGMTIQSALQKGSFNKKKGKRGRGRDVEEIVVPVVELDQIKKRPAVVVQYSGQRIAITELSRIINVPLTVILKEFLMKGLLFNLNSEIDVNSAKEIATTFNTTIETDAVVESIDQRSKKILEAIELKEIDDVHNLKPRPPVVTIMGHVDHGKTKLLDAIRTTNVVDSEAGGITQHIGAYQIELKGKLITFLDTPGHEAFTTLRARGAQATDIAILVVAADDGVMPQTIEAIDHARSAGVPIIVALNKIDKDGVNIETVKQQLTKYDLVAEEWGGKTIMVPVSAKFNKGIDDLLEMIILVAEMQDYRANPDRLGKGVVIEAKLSKQKGPIATVLVKQGTLRVGDPFVIGSTSGRIRAMCNERGQEIIEAPPSTPVEISGMSDVPKAGDVFDVVADERTARLLAEKRADEEIQQVRKRMSQLSLEAMSKQIAEGKVKDLNLLIKADVNGSLEALVNAISKLVFADVAVHIIHHATGSVNEGDVMLAKASSAVVLCFHLENPAPIEKMAEEEGVTIKGYDVIYKLIDDIQLTLEGMLTPEYEEVEIGRSDVRQIFTFSKVGKIAGCYVTQGKVIRNCDVQVIRNTENIFKGQLESLKRFQEDTREVNTGYECGIVVKGFPDIREGDQLIFSQVVEKKRALSR